MQNLDLGHVLSLSVMDAPIASVGARSSKIRPRSLVARFSQIDGYRCLSLMRAFGVVKCQLALA